jgi:hypothetical protein
LGKTNVTSHVQRNLEIPVHTLSPMFRETLVSVLGWEQVLVKGKWG